VVAGITAYNFPLPLLVRKLGGALAAGCTCVILPSERAPLSTWRFFKLLEEVGFPEGAANLVMGGRDAGIALTTSPLVDLVSFTGSVAVGQEVMRQASSTTKKVVLELGGKSPTIILPGADISRAVGPSIDRFVIATGQGCGVTSRTLVAQGDYDAYLEAATEYIGGIPVGNPRKDGVLVGPLVRDEQRASVEGYVERALEAGGQILAGGGRPDEPAGYFMNPTYLGGLDNDSEVAQNELFGPVGVLMPYGSVDDAIEMANKSRYGLYASVWGPTGDAMAVARRLSSGTVAINGGGVSRPDVPWGGFRDTGIGRESGEDGFREFFEVKHIEWPL
jgi:aldehyde dehydrogenase (NAD+)/betaine-aldehyde dehydrogenase